MEQLETNRGEIIFDFESERNKVDSCSNSVIEENETFSTTSKIPKVFSWQTSHSSNCQFPLVVTPPYTPRFSSYTFYSPPYSFPSSQNSSPEVPPLVQAPDLEHDADSSEEDNVVDSGKTFDSRVLIRGIGETAKVELILQESGLDLERLDDERELSLEIEGLSLLSSPTKSFRAKFTSNTTPFYHQSSDSPFEETLENEISISLLDRFPLVPKLYPNSTFLTPPRRLISKKKPAEEDSPYQAPSPHSTFLYQRLFSNDTGSPVSSLLPSNFDTPLPFSPPFNTPRITSGIIGISHTDSISRINSIPTRAATRTTLDLESSPEISPDHSHNDQNQYSLFKNVLSKKGSLIVGDINGIESIQAFDAEVEGEKVEEEEEEKKEEGEEAEVYEEEEIEEREGNQNLLEAMSPLSRCFRRNSLKPDDDDEEEDENRREIDRGRVIVVAQSSDSSSNSNQISTPSSDSNSVIEFSTQDIKSRRFKKQVAELEGKLSKEEGELKELFAARTVRDTIRKANFEGAEGLKMEMGSEKEQSLSEVFEGMGIDLATKSPLILSSAMLGLTICPHCSRSLPSSTADPRLQIQAWKNDHWSCLKEIGSVIVLGGI